MHKEDKIIIAIKDIGYCLTRNTILLDESRIKMQAKVMSFLSPPSNKWLGEMQHPSFKNTNSMNASQGKMYTQK